MFSGHQDFQPPKVNPLPPIGRNYRRLPPDESKRTPEMSIPIWCDINDPETNIKGQIGHPFSAKDINRRHFEQTETVAKQTGNSYGQPTYQEHEEVTTTIDMCGYHWAKQNPFQPRQENTPLAEIEAECEESEADMWRAKYEAERARKS